MKIAMKLKELRMTKGLTQREFATELRIGSGVISDIESGRRKPSKNIAIVLSKYTNTSVENWLYETETNNFVVDKEEFTIFRAAIEKLKESGNLAKNELKKSDVEFIIQSINMDLKFFNIENKEEK
jgi:transcriptional regulator with XRE-family HTH domain